MLMNLWTKLVTLIAAEKATQKSLERIERRMDEIAQTLAEIREELRPPPAEVIKLQAGPVTEQA